MKNKIYCKECVYFMRIIEDIPWCSHPNLPQYEGGNSWYEEDLYTEESPRIINKNNDCPYFKFKVEENYD